MSESVNETTALEIRKFDSVVQSVIYEAPFEILRGRTPKKFIKKRPGKGGKTFSYVSHGYVTSVLNKAFGFHWNWEIVPQGDGNMFVYLPEVKNDDGKRVRPGSFIVHGKLTVYVHNPANPIEVIATIVKTATGEKEELKGMTWGGHIKSAESDAFKKAASRLGVALDLYWQDADEDYLDEQVEKSKDSVDAMRVSGLDDAEIAVKLDEEGMGRSAIAKVLGVKINQVIRWLNNG